MKSEVFLALPHREKDRIVAKYVDGLDTFDEWWYRHPVTGNRMQVSNYSTDLRSSWQLGKHFHSFRLSCLDDGRALCVLSSGKGLEQWWGMHTCPEIAIVLACLNKVGYIKD